MWIEITIEEKKRLINMQKIVSIKILGDAVHLYLTDDSLDFYFDDESLSQAVYEGFKLALNGIDFITHDFDKQPIIIKPLLSDKTEEMYKYLRYKELLAEIAVVGASR